MRYGARWKEELKAACAKPRDGEKGYVCVTDMMDHVVEQMNELFSETPYADSWVLFHDALKAWWEPEAQEHLLKVHGIGAGRQLCIQGGTNDDVAAHYKGKLVGDSPEFCPLDSNLFSDFEFAMRQNIAYSDILPHDHPEKFLCGRAGEVQDLMERTWAHPGAVTSERIVEDICRFPKALDLVLAAKGAKVPELDNRKGRRATKRYEPPHIALVEELTEIKYRRLDPEVGDGAPARKRQR